MGLQIGVWSTESSLMLKMMFLTETKYPESLIFFIRIVSEIGGQEGGFLEDIEGSWLVTWRTGSSLMLWLMFFYSKKFQYILKVRVDIFIISLSGMGSQERGSLKTMRVPNQRH